MQTTAEPRSTQTAETTVGDEAFIQRLNTTIEEATTLLHNLKPGLAADILYDSFWHWLCDEAIEEQKAGTISLSTLQHGMFTYLRLLHPFVPHVTEQIWQELRDEKRVKSEVLALTSWPTPNETTP